MPFPIWHLCNSWSPVIEINTGTGGPVSPRFWVFFVYNKFVGRTDNELVRGCTVRQYEQLETSPETIEQELQPAVCEHRQIDRQTRKENYIIYIYTKIHCICSVDIWCMTLIVTYWIRGETTPSQCPRNTLHSLSTSAWFNFYRSMANK